MSTPGSVYQRSDGKWCASLQADGKRKTLYAKSERDARKKLADLQGQMATIGTLPNPGKRSVDDLLDAFLESKGPNWKPSTLDGHRIVCDLYIRPHIGHVKLSRLEPLHLERLYKALAVHGKRAASKAHSTLHSACELALRWRWLGHNPADLAQKPSYRPERKALWTEQQLQTFLVGTGGDWLHPLWVTASSNGMPNRRTDRHNME